MKYSFIDVPSCNMCGDKTINSKVLGKRLNQSQGRNPRGKHGITTTVIKCNSCGLIYADPLPIPFDIQSHYGVPPESYWKEEYFHINPNYFVGQIEVLQRMKPFEKGQKALDIGAGVGKGMIVLDKFGYDVYGMEASKSFYDKAINTMKISKDKLICATIEEADYPDNYFDFITFSSVLEHFYDPNDCLKRALRWLKKDGVIHIEVPSSDWLMSKLFNFYYKIIGTDYVTNISPMHSPYHLYEFTKDSFDKNGLNNNYIVEEKYYYPCDTYMPKFIDKLLKWYMGRTNKGMQLAVWLRKT